PLRENVGDSYRLGLEVDALVYLGDQFIVRPNLALSTNKNLDFFTHEDGEVKDLGNTDISYSPEVIAGNMFTYMPKENIQLSLLSKYVSSQYLGNTGVENSKLDSYFVNDLNLQYTIKPKALLKSITLSALVNNIFDATYSSNGFYYTYDQGNDDGSVTTYDGTGYYPQAGINFLIGATVRF